MKKGIDVGLGKKTEAQMAQEIEGIFTGEASSLMPVPLNNMIKTAANIQEKITAMQASPSSGDVTHLRTYMMSYYGNLMNGGDPAPEALEAAAIKLMPEYKELVAGYPALHQALAALEMQIEQCTFGYQMADGTIYAPDVNWTSEQWESMREQSVDQTARCWKVEAPVAPVAEAPAAEPATPTEPAA